MRTQIAAILAASAAATQATCDGAALAAIVAVFPIHAAQLFNSLPEDIRNLTDCSIDTFKSQLDCYLHTIPDEPQITGYTAHRRAETNSILDMGYLSHYTPVLL